MLLHSTNEETTTLQPIEHGALQKSEEKGAIGAAFLVWLFGGGLGLAILVFLLLKIF